MLGEASTTEIARQDDAHGFKENLVAARSGGQVAGNARKDLETRTAKKVISQQHHLLKPKKRIE